eukprot:gene1204-biopygen973
MSISQASTVHSEVARAGFPMQFGCKGALSLGWPMAILADCCAPASSSAVQHLRFPRDIPRRRTVPHQRLQCMQLMKPSAAGCGVNRHG